MTLPLSKDKVYYLASPYSNTNPFIQDMRYVIINYIATVIIKKGYNVIEPIVSSHIKDLDAGYAFWKSRDRALIKHCDGIIVTKMKGWKKSIGVQDELAYAKELGLEIHYLEPKSILTDKLMKELL